MTVIVEDVNDKHQMSTKGAVEEMLSVCSFAEYNGKVEPLTEELKAVVLQNATNFNNKGFRVLGIAHKNLPSVPHDAVVKEEKDMVLIGYLAFWILPRNPPRKLSPSSWTTA